MGKLSTTVFHMRNREPVGPAVRTLRLSLGLTIRELSEIAGVAPSYLSQVENNLKAPSPSWISNLLVAVSQHQTMQRQVANAA